MADRLKLYVKAGKDGNSLGDCPFCHYAMMVCRYAAVDVDLVFVDLANKSADFMTIGAKHGGTVPVLSHGDDVIAGSGQIAAYIQKMQPLPDLSCSCDALDAIKGVFPAFAAMMKNKDDSKRSELKEKLEGELGKANAWLSSNPGPYLCGEQLTLPDFELSSRLLHVTVAGKHYFDFSVPSGFPSLLAYQSSMFQETFFTSTRCDDSEIVHGWSKFFS